MHVLCWNMGVGSPGAPSARHEEAWAWLVERTDFDVALLQEVRQPPARLAEEGWSAVWRPKQTKRGATWGSAVIARNERLVPWEPDASFPWLAAFPGAMAIAQTEGSGMWFASLHCSHRKISPEVIAALSDHPVTPTSRNGTLWETDVLPHDLRHLLSGQRFVWGGDLNSDPRMDDLSRFMGGNRALREVWASWGSLDARVPFFNEMQRTYFNPRSGNWQLDHVFVDPETYGRLTSWSVDAAAAEGDAAWSDHAPILVAFEDVATDL